MDRVGSPSGNYMKNGKGGNNFPSEKGKRKLKG
jgi:hypothetical protein